MGPVVPEIGLGGLLVVFCPKKGVGGRRNSEVGRRKDVSTYAWLTHCLGEQPAIDHITGTCQNIPQFAPQQVHFWENNPQLTTSQVHFGEQPAVDYITGTIWENMKVAVLVPMVR